MQPTALPPASGSSGTYQRPRGKNDIVSQRNRPAARLWRFLRTAVPVTAGAGLLFWMWASPEVLNIVLLILARLFQIVFALFYAIIQFVAIFWFMSQTKMESIRPEDAKSVTFKEYWGQPTLVNLVKQWISLLSDREQFVKMGGKYINGILLYGPPGTGKTMLAKAMAGEAGIPFISVEGSGFRGMFWGVDVLRMIQFVGKAKKLAREYGACIAYIDEIDAVGASRGGVMGGGGMMGGMGGMMGGTSGALTRLLYEMDGIEDKPWLERLRDRWFQFIGKEAPKRTWHVLFMGSTNRPDVLDPALLRPGRFDQKINVDPPDKAGRREVIRGYLTKIKHDDTVDIEAIVEDTPHTTPAQIAAAITKDAVRIALFKGRDRIGQRDIDQALQEQFLGIEQPIEEMDPEQRRQVAYHEAGHAVAQHYLMPDQRIVRVSIVRRGGAYGYMLPVDRIEVYVEPLRRIAADIMVSMAGHVAVKLATGEYWTGAYGDNRQIRRGIWRLYTLGYFGPPVLSADGGAGVPPSAAPLIERFWRTLEEQTENLLRQHYDELEGIAQLLLEKSDLSHDDVMPLLGDNGWRPTGSIVGRREPAQLPAAVKLPLPAPGEAAEPEPVVSEPAPVTAAVVEPVPDVPARKRMIRPPRPEDLARRPAPEPEPAKAEKADEKKE